MTAKLSVIVPCRNERINLRACVASVREIADEIIISDSGSTDGTLQIAQDLSYKSAGVCRLIEGEWTDYATFKNWANPQASHSWVLILDADERVSESLAKEIRETIATSPEDIDGYWIRFRSFFLGYELRYAGYNSAALRLFRRDRCRYSMRRVHEEIDIDRQRAGRLNAKILHYSIWSYDQYFSKWVKYTRLGADELWAQGKRASRFSLLARPFLRFFQMYILRRGFLDGFVGLQVCMLTAFFNTFVKQARLWEKQHGLPRPESHESDKSNRTNKAA